MPRVQGKIPVGTAQTFFEKARTKLWVGYLYQSHGQLDEAKRLYEEVIQEARVSEEAAAARELLSRALEPAPEGTLGSQPGKGIPSLQKAAPVAAPAPSLVTGPSAAIPHPEAPKMKVATFLDSPVKAVLTVFTPPPPSLEHQMQSVAWLESSLPVFIQVTADRLASLMQRVGETELTRSYTQKEFQRVVLRSVQAYLPNQMEDVATEIHPDGVVGSGTVLMGGLTFRLRSRVGIALADERPHVVIHEVRVGDIVVPEPLLKLLEMRVNQRVDQERYPLKFKRIELREGSALMSVELE